MWRVEIASVLIRTCLQSRFDRGSLYKGGSFEECSSEHQSSTQGDRVRRPSDRKHGGSSHCEEEDFCLKADGEYLGCRQEQEISWEPHGRIWRPSLNTSRTRIGSESALIHVSLSIWRDECYCSFVVLGTGHMFAAGYDIRTRETYEESMASFDRIVGFKYLKGMHINDSQGGGFNCKKDRHENIGL